MGTPAEEHLRFGHLRSVGDPDDGLPQALLESLPTEATASQEALFDHLRHRAYAEYALVRESSCAEYRREHMLLANAWLAVSEQSVVQPAVALAFRLNLRAVGSPLRAVRRTQREWLSQPVSSRRNRVEVAAISRGAMRLLDYQAPPGALQLARARNKNGKVKIVKWYREQLDCQEVVAQFRELGEPFCHFDLPETCDFWPSLRQRLGVILMLMMQAHDHDWFVSGSPGTTLPTPKWSRFEREALAMLEVLTREV